MNRKKLEKRYAYGNLMIFNRFQNLKYMHMNVLYTSPPPIPPIDFKKCALAFMIFLEYIVV